MHAGMRMWTVSTRKARVPTRPDNLDSTKENTMSKNTPAAGTAAAAAAVEARANKNTFAERAASEPTELHKAFAAWLEEQTGVKVDLKTVQLATTMRMDFQRSDENQAHLAERKAAAKAKKDAAAAATRARKEAQLKKLQAELSGDEEAAKKAAAEEKAARAAETKAVAEAKAAAKGEEAAETKVEETKVEQTEEKAAPKPPARRRRTPVKK